MPFDVTYTSSPPPAVGCPDEDLVSRFVEGTLSPARREDVERHLANCDDCRQVVAGLARAGVSPTAREPHRAFGVPLRAVAVAAAVVTAFGVYALLRPSARTPDTDARLVAAANDLAARRPDLFSGFTPLDATERRGRVADVRRGGLSLLLPTGTTLAARPDFRWSPVAGAKSYDLTVIDAEGTTVLRTAATEPVVPGASLPKDLARGGDFVWKVKAIGASPSAEGTRAFSVAREDAATAFAAGRDAIAALAPDVPRDLLLAHFALRRGLLSEALDAARRHAVSHPDDRVGREMLDHLLQAIGPGATGLR